MQPAVQFILESQHHSLRFYHVTIKFRVIFHSNDFEAQLIESAIVDHLSSLAYNKIKFTFDIDAPFIYLKFTIQKIYD